MTKKAIFYKHRPAFREIPRIVTFLNSIIDWTNPPDLYTLVRSIMEKFKVSEGVARDHCILHANY